MAKLNDVEVSEFRNLFGHEPIIKIMLDNIGYTSKGKLNKSKLIRSLNCTHKEFDDAMERIKTDIIQAGYHE